MPTSNKTTAEQIRDTVVEAYLESGKSLTAAEIAQRLGWSASKVYKAMRDGHGSVEGIATYEDSRESHSTSYKMFVTGSHKVWVYRPTMATLRQMILELRAKP